MTTTDKPRAYCVKCRTHQDMGNAKEVVMKNDRPALRGQCVQCGTTIQTFLKMNQGA